MNKKKIINNSIEKFLIIFFSILSIYISWFLGTNQIIEDNLYYGMSNLNFDNNFFIASIFIFLVYLIFLFSNLESSEGIILTILIFFSFIWFLFFYSVTNIYESKHILFGSILIIFPLFLLTLSSNFLKINYKLDYVRDGFLIIRLEFVITLLLIIIIFKLYNILDINFSFSESYERRLLAREKIHGLFAYFFNMSLNALAPLLAFLAIYNKKYLYFLISVIFGILSFGFVGTKAPILYILILSCLAIFYEIGFRRICLFLVSSMMLVLFLSYFEFLIFKHSIIADYFVRRAIFVLPQVNVYFLDFILNYDSFFDVFWFGSNHLDKEINFLIGDLYFKNPEANVSTLSFLVELGRRGFMGYIFNISFLIFFCTFCSYMHRNSNHDVWNVLSILVAFLLLEQGITTILVTSGIGLSVLLLCLFSYKKAN